MHGSKSPIVIGVGGDDRLARQLAELIAPVGPETGVVEHERVASAASDGTYLATSVAGKRHQLPSEMRIDARFAIESELRISVPAAPVDVSRWSGGVRLHNQQVPQSCRSAAHTQWLVELEVFHRVVVLVLAGVAAGRACIRGGTCWC